jgi:hypothetical protein
VSAAPAKSSVTPNQEIDASLARDCQWATRGSRRVAIWRTTALRQ